MSKDNNNKPKEKENIHKNHRQRMYERFDKVGFEGWSDIEIVEYMLYCVFSRGNTNPTAHKLLDYSRGSLINLLDNAEDWRMAEDIKGVGEQTVRFLRALKEFMAHYREVQMKEKPLKLSRDNFLEILRTIEFSQEKEELVMLCLDKFMRIKCQVRLTEDSDSNYATTGIDRLVRAATRASAANVILVHNHPSGYSDVSVDDIHMTIQARKILDTFNIFLVDHFIVCGDNVVSIMMTMGDKFE